MADLGARVPVPEVGSLTSRLLSAVLCASAKTAAASGVESRDSLSANSRRVFGYAPGPRSGIGSDRLRRDQVTPPGRGEEDAPASSPPPPPPLRCVRYLAEPTDSQFAVGACHGSSEAFRLVKSEHETRSRRDSEGRARAAH